MYKTVAASGMEPGQIGIVRINNEMHYVVATFNKWRNAKSLVTLSTNNARSIIIDDTVLLISGAKIIPVVRIQTLFEDYYDRHGSIAFGVGAPSLLCLIGEAASGELNLENFEMTVSDHGRTYCTSHWDIVAPNSLGEMEVIYERRPPPDPAPMIG